jgi:hypothetical protein
VKQLEDQKVPVKVDMNLLTGSQWTTVYTTSTGDRTACQAQWCRRQSRSVSC